VRAAVEQSICEIVEQGERRGLWAYKTTPTVAEESNIPQPNLHNNERVNNEDNNNNNDVVFDGFNR